MTQAAEVMQSAADAEAAMKAAELLTDLVEHEGEATLFTFDDDSVLVLSGAHMSAFDGIQAALASLAA